MTKVPPLFAPEKPVGNRDHVSTRSLREPLRIVLAARPGGLREPLLAVLLADPEPPTPRKLRSALRRLGAVPGDDLRWALPSQAAGERGV